MIDKVRRTVEQYHMLARHDRLIIGVSGGADSVALLMAMVELRREYLLELAVVHVNHRLRVEAEEEECYVKRLCDDLDIPCRIYRRDVAAYAKEQNCSLEDAGRSCRYECFLEAAQDIYGSDGSAVKVAVAHHMNDRAETMLFHMVRGTGLRGLRGIPPVRCQDNVNIPIIRPFYQVTRQDIEAYLKDKQMVYYTDATNACNAYSRNRIRNQVIPELTIVNRQAVSHMAALSEQASEYWNYVEQQAVQYEQQHGVGHEILIQTLSEQPDLLQRHIIYRQLVRISGHTRDWEEKHVHMVLELAKKEGGKSVNLPYQIQVTHCYDRLLFHGKEYERNIKKGYIRKQTEPIQIQPDSETCIGGIGILACRLLRKDELGSISKKIYTKMLDYDTINNALYLRNPLPEDYMIVNEQGSHKKLSRIFIDEKIPRMDRSHILVLAAGSQIIWIPGIRIGENVKITDHTVRVLQLDFTVNPSEDR